MAYSSTSVITASDYNTLFKDPLNKIIGRGNDGGGSGGAFGYGQTNTIAAVTGGSDTITATQWSNLFTRLRSTLNHQGSTTTLAAGNPATADTIAIKSGLTTDITTVATNKAVAAAGSLNSAAAITGLSDATRTSAWASTITLAYTVTFAASGTAPASSSAMDAARYFFNTGGYLQLGLTTANGSGTQDTAWTNLITAMGSIRFGANGTTKSGGSGTPTTLASSIGYYGLTTTNQTIFKQFDTTASYTANYIQLDVRSDSITDVNSLGGKGSTLTFTLTLSDAHTNAFSDTVNLDVTNQVRYVGHNTTYLNNQAWAITGAITNQWT